jgi:transposase
MSNVPKRVFTHEYRAEAVKLVISEGIIVAQAARELGLSVKTYSRWVRDARVGQLASVDSYRVQPVTDLQAEVCRLKRELAIACEERDILKKAAAYFAKAAK